MKLPNVPPVYLVAGAAVAGAVLFVAWKGPRGTGETIGAGAVQLVDGLVGGVVNTVGEAVGIPRTDMSACELAKAEGRTWDASVACPAGDFLRYVWN